MALSTYPGHRVVRIEEEERRVHVFNYNHMVGSSYKKSCNRTCPFMANVNQSEP